MTVIVCVCSPGSSSQIDANVLVHFQDDLLPLNGLETLELNSDSVSARKQAGCYIFSRLIRDQCTGDAALHIQRPSRWRRQGPRRFDP